MHNSIKRLFQQSFYFHQNTFLDGATPWLACCFNNTQPMLSPPFQSQLLNSLELRRQANEEGSCWASHDIFSCNSCLLRPLGDIQVRALIHGLLSACQVFGAECLYHWSKMSVLKETSFYIHLPIPYCSILCIGIAACDITKLSFPLSMKQDKEEFLFVWEHVLCMMTCF